jgi:hypothetical protein
MNKTILPIAIVIMVVVVSATHIPEARASILFNYAQGNDDGVRAARNNFPNGDASCPVNFFTHISYCTGYHVGYNYEWTLLQAAGVK